MPSNPTPREPGKIHDPVFFCMIAAIILAVISSIALRAMVSHAGPTAARADTTDMTDPAPGKPAPHANANSLVNAESK